MAKTTLLGLNRYWGKFYCSRLNEVVYLISRAKDPSRALAIFKKRAIKSDLTFLTLLEESPLKG